MKSNVTGFASVDVLAIKSANIFDNISSFSSSLMLVKYIFCAINSILSLLLIELVKLPLFVNVSLFESSFGNFFV